MTEPGATLPPAVIRVFVSSTFRDLGEERDVLVKQTFPEVRKRCAARGVEFAPIDLRWGVDDEHAVLSTCLEEIRRSSLFVGILGERYGSLPADEPGMDDAEPWLREHPGVSLTELEILYGALEERSEMAARLFYFRDPGYAEGRGPDYQSEDERARDRVDALKHRIVQRGLASRDGRPFADPEELGRWVLEDLTEVIDQLVPEDVALDAVQRETLAHRHFGEHLLLLHVGVDDVIRRIDDMVENHRAPVIVTGPPGVGKSALLARWAAVRAGAGEAVVVHHAEASDLATSWRNVVIRVASGLIDRFDLDHDIPDDDDGLRRLLGHVFASVDATAAPVSIVIDGIDRLVDEPGALSLAWLPDRSPDGMSVVLASRSGPTATEVARRGGRRIELRDLTGAERHDLAVEYLGRHGKTLPETSLDRLAGSGTSNPRFLLVLLNELRQWGDYRSVGDEVVRLGKARDMQELVDLVIDRLERDFDERRPDLVRDFMSLLWAAPGGLSEAELADLLGDGDPVPHAWFAPLLLAVEPVLTSSAGLFRIADPGMRRAVADRYLLDPAAEVAVHRRVAGYFAGRPMNARAALVLPAALAAAGETDALFDLLTDPPSMTVAYETDRDAVARRWRDLEARGRSVADGAGQVFGVYQGFATDRERFDNLHVLFMIAELLERFGYLGMASAAWGVVSHECRVFSRPDSELVAAVGHHRSLDRAGRAREAAAVEGRLAQLDREHPALRGRLPVRDLPTAEEACAQRAGARGVDAYTRGAFDEALAAFDEQKALLRRAGDQTGLLDCLINESAVLAAQGRVDQALMVLQGQEEKALEAGDHHSLATCLGHRARIELTRGALDAAEAALDEQSPLLAITGSVVLHVDHLAVRAGLLSARGDPDTGSRVLSDAIDEARTHGLIQRAEGLQQVLDEDDLSLITADAAHGTPSERKR